MKNLALLLVFPPLFLLPALRANEAPQDPQDCRACDFENIDRSPRATLTIRWKRAVDGADGAERTAGRHAGTERAVDSAFATLKRSLEPLGVTVELQKVGLTREQVAEAPLKSNRIWLNGVALENVLPEARTGETPGEGGVALRTVEFAGGSYADLPAGLIVQAGLVAAGRSVEQALAELQALVRGGGVPAGSPGDVAGSCADGEPARAGCCPAGAGE